MPEDTTTTTSTTTRRPCDACYNGCVQTVSDQCVRYTGLDSAPLDIVSGDNLQVVIENIINNLVPLLTGEGDRITLSAAIRCAIVNGYLPAPVDTDQWTSEQIFQALVKVVCDLQTQIDGIDAELVALNADYTIECLTGVTSSSDTHDIVQAIITKLCDTVAELAALQLDVDTNYVKLSDLDALIAAYIASSSGGSSNQQYLKMVPYVAYEYYGPLTNFDGAGIGFPANGFYKVYLCNGLNGTPDKRGRVTVGAINNVPPIGIGLDPTVDPAASPSNPNYDLYSIAGSNAVTLTTAQIPAHSHVAIASSTATVSPNPHSHNYAGTDFPSGSGTGTRTSVPTNKITSSVDLSVAVATSVTVNDAGGGGSHTNIQPVIGAYYIMYIP